MLSLFANLLLSGSFSRFSGIGYHGRFFSLRFINGLRRNGFGDRCFLSLIFRRLGSFFGKDYLFNWSYWFRSAENKLAFRPEQY